MSAPLPISDTRLKFYAILLSMTFRGFMKDHYLSEGRWFNPSRCHWKFSLTQNPPDRTMALGSTQPLTEISTRSISWGKGGRCVRLTTLPQSCAVVMKYGNINFLEPSRPLQACNGTTLPLPLPVVVHSCTKRHLRLERLPMPLLQQTMLTYVPFYRHILRMFHSTGIF